MSVETDLVIASRVEEIARARQWAGDAAAGEGFSSKHVHDLGLVVSEACANVIRHAYCGEPDHVIELHLVIDEAKLVLSIRDEGRMFDVDAYQAPDLSEPHEGGYGVFIIRSLMDEATYDVSQGNGTKLTLVKYREG